MLHPMGIEDKAEALIAGLALTTGKTKVKRKTGRSGEKALGLKLLQAIPLQVKGCVWFTFESCVPIARLV